MWMKQTQADGSVIVRNFDDVTYANFDFKDKGWTQTTAPAPPVAAPPAPSPMVLGTMNPLVLTPGLPPTSPVAGQIYVDAAGIIHVWSGKVWVP